MARRCNAALGGHGRIRKDSCLAPPRHHRALVDRVVTASHHFLADLRIQQAGCVHAGTACTGKTGKPGIAAGVEAPGFGQHTFDHGAQSYAEHRPRQPLPWFDAGLVHPGLRQIKPAGAGVLADIPGDVGKLHRHAEVAGACDQLLLAHAHDHRHHRTYRAGHPHCVSAQLSDALVAAPGSIPFEAFQQRQWKAPWDREALHTIGKRAVGRHRDR